MKVHTKSSLFEAIVANEARLQALGVGRIGVFGSFIRNEQRDDSDVDVLVDFLPRQKNFDNFMTLSDLLEELSGRRVEVVTRESLSPFLAPHILREVEYVPFSN